MGGISQGRDASQGKQPRRLARDGTHKRSGVREVPLWKANKGAWPPGVRPIGMDEADCLGVDRRGNLCWDG